MGAVRPPEEVAEKLATEAPDQEWLRALVDDLDRRLAAKPLERLIRLWGLSGAEVGRIFGVSRQAVSKWRDQGVPPGRADDVAALAAATELLDRYVKRERIPAVVRRPAEELEGRSLYEVASDGEFDRVREQVQRMFDLARVQA